MHSNHRTIVLASCLVKPINHFEQNRPVHLARRDAYFERAVELVSAQQNAYVPDIRIDLYEEILFLLRIAREHGFFAIREAGKNEKDEQFGKFIRLLEGNAMAVLSMMELKGMVENPEGSFFSFLGANQASVALQAEEYQRRANDIVRSMLNTLRLAEEPFATLKEEYMAACREEDLARYKKAREHFTGQIRTGRHRPDAAIQERHGGVSPG